MSESLPGLHPISELLCEQRGWVTCLGSGVDALEAFRVKAEALSCKVGGLVSHRGPDIYFFCLPVLPSDVSRQEEYIDGGGGYRATSHLHRHSGDRAIPKQQVARGKVSDIKLAHHVALCI